MIRGLNDLKGKGCIQGQNRGKNHRVMPNPPFTNWSQMKQNVFLPVECKKPIKNNTACNLILLSSASVNAFDCLFITDFQCSSQLEKIIINKVTSRVIYDSCTFRRPKQLVEQLKVTMSYFEPIWSNLKAC